MTPARLARTSLFGLALVTTTILAGTAAQAAPPPASTPIWSSANTSTTGCPASLHVLTPTRPTSYFAAHPDDLLVVGPFHDSSGATAHLLKDVAARPMHWLSTVSCRAGQPGHPAPRKSTVNATSANWAGYVTGVNRGYIGATMEWPIHAVTNPTSGTADSSTWPGIGSGNSQSDALIQAGVQQERYCSGTGGSGCSAQTNTPWLEIYPQEVEQDISNLTVNVLDLVGVIVEYDPLTAVAYFEIDDLTSNTGVYGYQDVDPDSNGITGSGSQAEWIVERPTVCFITCAKTTLVNFGTQPIIDAESVDGLWSEPTYRLVSGDSPYSDDMKSCNGSTLLASTGGLTSGENFNVTWHAAGKYESC